MQPFRMTTWRISLLLQDLRPYKLVLTQELEPIDHLFSSWVCWLRNDGNWFRISSLIHLKWGSCRVKWIFQQARLLLLQWVKSKNSTWNSIISQEIEVLVQIMIQWHLWFVPFKIDKDVQLLLRVSTTVTC